MNTHTDYESTVEDVTKLFMGEEPVQAEESETPPVEETVTEEAKIETPEVSEDDDLLSIVDALSDEDETEAGKDPENSEESEEEEEQEEGDDTTHLVKIDGEEHEVSLAELKKGYGLQQSLTRKGQELADMRKKLDEEAQAVAWAKAQPEAREKVEQINEALEAVQRGFVFGENGEQVRLTKEQIEATQKNIEEAQAELSEIAKPPRLDELYEALPALKQPASEEAQNILKPFGDTLSEFGYSQPEITSLNDPRTFLMLKELHELRELRSRVEKAKASRKEKKPATASKVTKSAKPAASTSKSNKEPVKNKLTIEQVNSGEISAADLFMEDL